MGLAGVGWDFPSSRTYTAGQLQCFSSRSFHSATLSLEKGEAWYSVAHRSWDALSFRMLVALADLNSEHHPLQDREVLNTEDATSEAQYRLREF
jgi:hypothetical protein